jgi:hypothetical protein
MPGRWGSARSPVRATSWPLPYSGRRILRRPSAGISSRCAGRLHGRAVRFLSAGHRPPLVLLHALGENALDWSWVMPALSRWHRLYAPGVVANAILYAAEKAPRDIVAGGAGKSLILGQRLSPRLMDAVMLRSGFGPQMTDELKSAYDPDGLYGPLVDHNRLDGDFDGQTLRGSFVTWLDTHPVVKCGAIVGAALGTAALLRART